LLHSAQLARQQRLDVLAMHLRPSRLPRICDVGANPIYGTTIYKPLLQRRLCEVYGFEPEPEAYRQCCERASDLETYFPVAVGAPGRRTFNVHKLSCLSSLFRISQKALRELGYPANWAKPSFISQIEIEAVALDDVPDLPPLDLMKADVEGAELEIILSGRQKLSTAVAIVAEVNFFQFYEGAPMFADVDRAMGDLGYRLHRFIGWNRFLVPSASMWAPGLSGNQVINADAAYIRQGDYATLFNDDQIAFTALAADVMFDSPDLTLRCLDILYDRGAVTRQALEHYSAALQGTFGQLR